LVLLALPCPGNDPEINKRDIGIMYSFIK